MVCKMVNYHKGYKMEFLFNCQLFFQLAAPSYETSEALGSEIIFRGGTQVNPIVLAFFFLWMYLYTHKKPGIY